MALHGNLVFQAKTKSSFTKRNGESILLLIKEDVMR